MELKTAYNTTGLGCSLKSGPSASPVNSSFSYTTENLEHGIFFFHGYFCSLKNHSCSSHCVYGSINEQAQLCKHISLSFMPCVLIFDWSKQAIWLVLRSEEVHATHHVVIARVWLCHYCKRMSFGDQ